MKKMLIKIILTLVLVGALTFLSLLTAVCACAGRTFETKPADCIIVLGAHVWMDGRMSNALLYRCEAALQAWKDGIAPSIIVCGSKGPDEPEAEAIAMRRWMLAHGVPGDRVIAEPDSVNTLQNLENARAIMDENGWRRAAVCTNNYHLTRALWLARDAGIEATGIAAPSTKDPGSFARGRLRESCSWALYLLRKTI